ncbi:hypothetical protein, partial [Paraburkholderia sp.]|uniref:hypothetical protein n=1 Tax=Paraburkholderia sp. TaxID=1926495 RepID=UPI002D536440
HFLRKGNAVTIVTMASTSMPLMQERFPGSQAFSRPGSTLGSSLACDGIIQLSVRGDAFCHFRACS